MKENARGKLVDVIRETKARYLTVGRVTSREIADDVIQKHPDLIRELSEPLAVAMVRAMVQDEMKSTIEANRNGHEQFQLPFPVPGIHSVITVPGKPETIYVSLRKATADELAKHVGLLKDQIRADSLRLEAVQKLSGILRPIFRTHLGITVEEACEIWKDENSRGATPPNQIGI